MQIDTSHGPLGCKITKLETSLINSLKLSMVKKMFSLLEHGLVLKIVFNVDTDKRARY